MKTQQQIDFNTATVPTVETEVVTPEMEKQNEIENFKKNLRQNQTFFEIDKPLNEPPSKDKVLALKLPRVTYNLKVTDSNISGDLINFTGKIKDMGPMGYFATIQKGKDYGKAERRDS